MTTSARTCLDCSATISAVSKGRCRKCANAVINRSPEHRAKTSASMKRRLADPVFRAEQTRLSVAGVKRAAQDPAWVERKRADGLKYGAPNIGSTRGAEARAKAGASISAVKLAHIPPSLRDDYRALKAKGLTKAERTAAVIDRSNRLAREAIERRAREQADVAARQKRQAY
jgi:hypothetical protein